MSDSFARRELKDLIRVIIDGEVWRSLAIMDIKGRYRRTLLGPFWLTISMAVTAVSIGFVFGRLFGVDIRTAIPYFVVGTVIWTFISGPIDEAATVLGQNGAFIRSSPMPVVFHLMRMVHRNFLFLLHNALIIPLLWLFMSWGLSWQLLLLPAGLLLCYVFVTSACVIVSFVCVRYRDLAPMVRMILQFMYFLTPILWQPQQMHQATWVFDYNPLYYLLHVVRAPLLGQSVDLYMWLVAGGVATIAALGASALYVRYSHRVVYWV